MNKNLSLCVIFLVMNKSFLKLRNNMDAQILLNPFLKNALIFNEFLIDGNVTQDHLEGLKNLQNLFISIHNKKVQVNIKV